jgi:tetratricopeptide (TPR) repeat protein
MTLSQTTLDDLWDFGDPAASERRLRQAYDQNPDAEERRELRTQIARAMGLQDRFTEAHAVLDALDLDDPTVAVRAALERGRLHNSAGAALEAAVHFRKAAELAAPPASPELTFLRIDALHMLGITDSTKIEDWTAQALSELAAVDDPRTLRWLVGLNNNLGWARFEAGDSAGALEAFHAASDAADQYGTPQQQVWAAEAIAEVGAAAGDGDAGS